MMRFLKKVEIFARFAPDNEDAENDAKPKTLILFGAAAVASKFESRRAAGGTPDASDLKCFRTYRWLLSEDEEKTLELWLRASVALAKDRMGASRAKALKNVDDADKEKQKEEEWS